MPANTHERSMGRLGKLFCPTFAYGAPATAAATYTVEPGSYKHQGDLTYYRGVRIKRAVRKTSWTHVLSIQRLTQTCLRETKRFVTATSAN